MLTNTLVTPDDPTPMFDVDAGLIHSVSDLAIHRRQHIPDWFIKQLNDERFDSANRPAGNFMKVASIPVSLQEDWLRKGFDILKEKPQAILNRLRAEGYDCFITTNKRL